MTTYPLPEVSRRNQMPRRLTSLQRYASEGVPTMKEMRSDALL